MTNQHPTVATWTPEPPPARRRRLGGGLVAALIAALVLFGGVGLFAARQMTAATEGGASPESAAAGLVTALADKDLDQAAGYLDAHERLLVTTYRDRLTDLLTGRLANPGSGSPVPELTARDLRFQRVAGIGGDDVAVVELVAGTVGGRNENGTKLEFPVQELNRRLVDQTKGAVQTVRAVAVRSDGRWRVSLLASFAEYGRLVSGAAEPDWSQLAGSGQPASGGAASPEAAVRDLAASATGGQQAIIQQLVPAERRVLAAYEPLLTAAQGGRSRVPAVRVEGLQTRTEPITDGVARVRSTDGQLVGGSLGQRVPLVHAGADLAPYVVAVQQDGTWYPSLLFTFTDWMLTQAERERP